MKRRYKLLLIILIGIVFTIVINSFRVVSKESLTSFGDGFSIGMTPYNVAGVSFNDYLKEKLENSNNLDSYNSDFSYSYQSIRELNDHLINNDLGEKIKKPIKQIIAKSSILTLSIGMDEFASKSLGEEITLNVIDTYISEINKFLSSIREFYDKDIVVIGLYPANKFTQKDAVDVNYKLKKLCGKYDAVFLDIIALSLNKDNFLEENSYYMNYLAHKEIAKNIFLYIKYK